MFGPVVLDLDDKGNGITAFTDELLHYIREVGREGVASVVSISGLSPRQSANRISEGTRGQILPLWEYSSRRLFKPFLQDS